MKIFLFLIITIHNSHIDIFYYKIQNKIMDRKTTLSIL